MATGDNRCKFFIKSNLLVLLTLVGVIVGFVAGLGLKELHPSKDAVMWIGILGESYLNVIKMMIVPLIASSIISGTASLDPKSNGKISLVSLSFILVTNFLGTLTGTVLCVLINPGGRSTKTESDSLDKIHIQTQDVFADLLRNILPDNLVAATFQTTMTTYTTENMLVNVTTNGTYSEELIAFIKGKKLGKSSGVNMLGILVVSSFFGMATAAVGKVGRPFYKFFCASTEIVIVILEKILWLTPVGVGSLIMREVCVASDLGEDVARLGVFIGTYMLALALMLFILHPLICFFIAKRNPFKFMATLTEPMLIALATTLTTVAMPESLRKLEGSPNNIDRRITRFVVPLCAAVCRIGSCTFLSSSCVFITQLENRDQNGGSIVLIVLLVTLMSFAIPAIPSGSLVTIIILLTAIGIPPEAASLLFAFDWFSDRMRSVVNIYFHCLTSAVTYQICKSSLEDADKRRESDKSDPDDIIIIPMLNQNGEGNEIDTKSDFIAV